MATLVLTAVGTALGGPLGGALGALAGRAIDGAIMGSKGYEGPRLKELAVTTSSYGSNIARHFGRVRAAGSVIWATDLVEHQEKSGSGKGKPKVTSYSYTISFAVALASRRISRVGRIWADGNLLRGAAEDLKVGGSLRIYDGAGDQPPDPLIESDFGDGCPAFRGMAYAVFEDLDLSDFGNRIPALTFEIIADDGSLTLRDMLDDARIELDPIGFGAMSGFSQDGGTDADLVAQLGTFYPMSCDGGGGSLTLRDAGSTAGRDVVTLPPAVTSKDGEFAARTGSRRNRAIEQSVEGVSLRYYDIERDYQPGMQRSRGRPGSGRVNMIEFPACLDADCARDLADRVMEARESTRDTISYRVATLDPRLRCGSLVRPAGDRGIWRVRSWEWRNTGVELELEALPTRLTQGVRASGDPGQSKPPVDVAVGSTILAAFEAPWDGTGSGSDRRIMVAASSANAGWRGAALYADRGDGLLIPAGTVGRRRVIVGTAGRLPPATPHLLDRQNAIVVQLVDPSFALTETDIRGLASGANQARIGEEIIQFANAEPLGAGLWRLSSLLRGRGATEHAIGGHVEGETFVLFDEALGIADELAFGSAAAPRLIAIGTGDNVPVSVPVEDPGATRRPLPPVKPVLDMAADGSLGLRWTRRSRGGWQWLDTVEVPLSEAAEAYEVRFVNGGGRVVSWRVEGPEWRMGPAQWLDLSSGPLPQRLEIRQVGSVSLSRPLIVELNPE
ncbi:MAG TPA: phage tail protein [Croceicoccus sp.]|nr:phage tail protein [Croceicoccus sp.]